MNSSAKTKKPKRQALGKTMDQIKACTLGTKGVELKGLFKPQTKEKR
jgi:hypothetical protein